MMAVDIVLGVAGPVLLVNLFHVCEHLGLFPDMFVELCQGVSCQSPLINTGEAIYKVMAAVMVDAEVDKEPAGGSHQRGCPAATDNWRGKDSWSCAWWRMAAHDFSSKSSSPLLWLEKRESAFGLGKTYFVERNPSFLMRNTWPCNYMILCF